MPLQIAEVLCLPEVLCLLEVVHLVEHWVVMREAVSSTPAGPSLNRVEMHAG